LALALAVTAVESAPPALTVAASITAIAAPTADAAAPSWDGSLGSGVALALIGLYRATLSATDLDVCAFGPSCSRFASDAVTENGLLRGTLLAADRLLRDHPFVPSLGYVRVPGTSRWADPASRYRCRSCE
jgi:putative component of membrane protein insertase Oxa1/YidC/SpoIIIJ protein YidD